MKRFGLTFLAVVAIVILLASASRGEEYFTAPSSGNTYRNQGTSMISFVKGKTEISPDLPD